MRSMMAARVDALPARVGPAGASLPLISTSGGRPGEKNRSLTLAEVLNIEARSSGVEMGAAAGAAAAALRAGAPGTGAGGAAAGRTGVELTGGGLTRAWLTAADAALGGRFAGDDIKT